MTYDEVAAIARQSGADPRKLFIALSQFGRMTGNSSQTIDNVMAGNFTSDGDTVTLDKSDPNRAQFEYLYSQNQ